MCNGLIRADEADSNAEEAYDNAFFDAVAGGIGAWRWTNEEEDEEDPDSEHQRLRCLPIYDADTSVYWGLEAKREDKSDAKRCWVMTFFSTSEAQEEYGIDCASFEKNIYGIEYDWSTPEGVYIAEFYEKEKVNVLMHKWKLIDGQEIWHEDSEEYQEDIPKLTAMGAEKIKESRVKRSKVHKYIVCGGGIVEDCGYIAGKHIPVVMLYGQRCFIDNTERAKGEVRSQKDPQRLYNMQASKLAEIAAFSSREKPIFDPEQMTGLNEWWTNDHLQDFPWLPSKALRNEAGSPIHMGPVAYTKPPQVPPALQAIMAITSEDINMISGNNQNPEEASVNTSGVGIELIQNRLDANSVIYIDNLAKAKKRSHEIWLSMAKDVYVEDGRKMKTLSAEDKVGQATIAPSVGSLVGLATSGDISSANLEVITTKGPTSASRKASTVRAATQMMSITQDPQDLKILTAYAMMNMEGEGIGDINEFYRRQLVDMGVIQPETDEDKQRVEAMQQQSSSNDQYLEAAAREADANAARAQADVVYKQAQADKARADTMETLSDIEAKESEQALKVIESMTPGLSQSDINF